MVNYLNAKRECNWKWKKKKKRCLQGWEKGNEVGDETKSLVVQSGLSIAMLKVGRKDRYSGLKAP